MSNNLALYLSTNPSRLYFTIYIYLQVTRLDSRVGWSINDHVFLEIKASISSYMVVLCIGSNQDLNSGRTGSTGWWSDRYIPMVLDQNRTKLYGIKRHCIACADSGCSSVCARSSWRSFYSHRKLIIGFTLFRNWPLTRPACIINFGQTDRTLKPWF